MSDLQVFILIGLLVLVATLFVITMKLANGIAGNTRWLQRLNNEAGGDAVIMASLRRELKLLQSQVDTLTGQMAKTSRELDLMVVQAVTAEAKAHVRANEGGEPIPLAQPRGTPTSAARPERKEPTRPAPARTDIGQQAQHQPVRGDSWAHPATPVADDSCSWPSSSPWGGDTPSSSSSCRSDSGSSSSSSD